MAQDLNNPRPVVTAPETPEQQVARLNSQHTPNTGDKILGYLSSAWKGIMGRNDYRAPESVYNPTASNEAQFEAGQSAEDRAMQQQAYGNMAAPNQYYTNLMNGTAPSLAQQQMNQGIAQANRQGMQSASGARGLDRAAAFRQAQTNAAQLNAQAAIAGGQQRLQEQQLGAQGYSQGTQAQSNMAQGLRSSDVGEQQGLMGLQNQAQSNLNQQYQTNAGITNQNASNAQKGGGGLIELGAGLLAGMSDIRAKENISPLAPGVEAKPNGFFAPSMAGAFGHAGQSTQGGSGGGMFNSQDSANFNAIGQGMASGGDSGGGPMDMMGGMGGATDAAGMGGGLGIGGLSDRDSKEALAPVKPYQFDYKDQFAHKMGMDAAQQAYAQAFQDAKAPRVGVMAQDLEKSPEGAQVVDNTPVGKVLDGKRALAFVMANQADMNQRLNRVEGGRGR
jgi:hypothetical protein